MHMKTWPILRVLVALVFVLTASGNAGGGEAHQLLVDYATTAEEHAASAEFYRGKARDQHEEAARHREMGVRYAQGSMGNRLEQQKHCDRIATLHARMAAEYEALGRNHQNEAAELRDASAGE